MVRFEEILARPFSKRILWRTGKVDRFAFVTPHSQLVPENSEEISQPPRTVQTLTDEGIIKRIPVPTNALVNRATAEWYLDRMRTETEWRLGFLAIVEHEKPYFPNSALPFDGVDGSLVHCHRSG